jgi:hypothetical protein
VQHREDDVDLGQRRPDGVAGLEDGEPARGRIADQGHGRAAGHLGQPTALDRQLLPVVGQHPPSVGRDADRHHLVPLRVQRRHDAPRGDARDRVLGAAAAEEHRHPDPAALPAHRRRP